MLDRSVDVGHDRYKSVRGIRLPRPRNPASSACWCRSGDSAWATLSPCASAVLVEVGVALPPALAQPGSGLIAGATVASSAGAAPAHQGVPAPRPGAGDGGVDRMRAFRTFVLTACLLGHPCSHTSRWRMPAPRARRRPRRWAAAKTWTFTRPRYQADRDRALAAHGDAAVAQGAAARC